MKKVKVGTTGNKIKTGSRTRMIAYCGIFFVIFMIAENTRDFSHGMKGNRFSFL